MYLHDGEVFLRVLKQTTKSEQSLKEGKRRDNAW